MFYFSQLYLCIKGANAMLSSQNTAFPAVKQYFEFFSEMPFRNRTETDLA